MAILESVPGVEVTVQIAGKDAIEYEADDEGKLSLAKHACPTATKYIEAIDDAKFAVKLAASCEYGWDYQKHALVFKLYIDGNHICSKLIKDSNQGEVTVSCKKAFCLQSRQWKSYNLKFSAITTIDKSHQERLEQDLEVAKRLGHIMVTVHRRIMLCRTGVQPKTPLVNKEFELVEKSMKGKFISHGTTFSSAKKIKTPKMRYTRALPKEKRPIAVFHFLYRSKDALQKSLIIPRSPPSPSLSSSSAQAFSKLPPGEIERLARERFEQMQRHEGLKNKAKPVKRKLEKIEDLTEVDENPIPTKRLTKFIDRTVDLLRYFYDYARKENN
ncbi:hypothetical protein F5Y12DRAFT_790008 [Xylaria sp. FL1777]|nr:hypothetical protein F5Y12DRAFT_790008 [Xylaria sp. FL1777]